MIKIYTVEIASVGLAQPSPQSFFNALASCVIQAFQHDLLPASLAHMSWTQAASSFNILVETACDITSNK